MMVVVYTNQTGYIRNYTMTIYTILNMNKDENSSGNGNKSQMKINEVKCNIINIINRNKWKIFN